MATDFLKIYNADQFDFFISMDCEGPIFDKNLYGNVSYLEKFLKLTSSNEIYTILFITPKFAHMLKEQSLINIINKNPYVIVGLHIHPNDLPIEIEKNCPFISRDIDNISDYSYQQQKAIIKYSTKYLEDIGLENIQGFRGGYFSINNDTEKALKAVTDIKWQSHNTYREQYKVTQNLLTPVPVYAYNATYEMRIEDHDISVLHKMLNKAIMDEEKVIATTHSYLLDSNDFHYERDNIKESLYNRVEKLIDIIQLYKDTTTSLESVM